MSFFDTMYN